MFDYEKPTLTHFKKENRVFAGLSPGPLHVSLPPSLLVAPGGLTSLNLWASFSGSISTGDSMSSFSARSNTSMALGNMGLISSSSSVAYSPVWGRRDGRGDLTHTGLTVHSVTTLHVCVCKLYTAMACA